MKGIRPSTLNPRFCNDCELIGDQYPGGAEADVAMLFVDIRGSTTIAEGLSPWDFSAVIDRFYRRATEVLVDAGALIEKLVGDEVTAIFAPGFAGRHYVRRAITAGLRLLEIGDADEDDHVGVPLEGHDGVAHHDPDVRGLMGRIGGAVAGQTLGDSFAGPLTGPRGRTDPAFAHTPPMLDRAARWFDLPAQAGLATDVVASILDTLHRVGDLHEFGKGLGLAAPQVGIDWAAAVVQTIDEGAPIVLLNPKVVGESMDRDEQYEGCLSFFDVRGLVSRPLLVEVEHASLDGERTVSTFRNATARLVAHEVDHLGGFSTSPNRV